MRVFVTGATGYIGFNVAQTFRRAGYEVWGLTRSEEKSAMLEQQEIYPAIGDMQHPQSFKEIAERCSVLIHAAADYEHDTSSLDKKTVQTLLDAGKHGAQPKKFIYTSGVWVLGNTRGKLVDETTPSTPLKMVAWRPDVEKQVVTSSNVKGLVIRPGCVYGKQGGLTGLWFHAAYNEKDLKPIGEGKNYWAMVHVDDLAEAYLKAAENGLGGEIFNITDRSRWTVFEMVNAVARAADYKGDINFIPLEEARQSMGPMAEALAIDQHVDARKAVRLLGWQPRHGGFVDEVETYFASWKAYQS